MSAASVTNDSAAGPGTIAAAVLLPPLGVYWRSGQGSDFLIACALTLAGFLPGVAFALIRVFGPRRL